MFAKTTLIAALTAAAVLGSAVSARAASLASAPLDPDVVSQAVFVGDIDLSSQTGARIALHRVEVAAASVCGEAPDVRDLTRSTRYRGCVRGAVDRAVVSLESPIVTALRSSRGVDVLASNR